MRSTLESLKRRGMPCVLGLRDVMDEPASLVEEWERKGVFPALDELYDDIWVYGLPEIFDPLSEIPADGPSRGQAELHRLPAARGVRGVAALSGPGAAGARYILVTTGGGGDGEDLIDWVIRGLRARPGLETGRSWSSAPSCRPSSGRPSTTASRATRGSRRVTFEAHVEPLFERAAAVVAMGGYNTFCEILSFGKRALLVPRTRPRMEQHLRAERAARLGLVRMLPDGGARDPALMAAALRELPHPEPPGAALRDRLLGGLERIADLSEPWLGGHHRRPSIVRCA